MLNHEKIDQFLAVLDKTTDDDELRQAFTAYSAAYDLNVPADPHGPAYQRHQMALYERLAGKKYTPANEVSDFDLDAAIASPFPYRTRSADTVGMQLMAIGFLIKAMALPRGARILEFGFGWGNTTLALAQMGYDVTAVDIEKNYCDLLGTRAEMNRQSIQVVHSDFDYLKTVEGQFDAVLYFECFHHAANHLELMAAFDRVVAPGGIVCFGAEPITPDFPVPWGLRMDGESLWAIRRMGWLELGFNEAYFESAMRRFGWNLTSHRGADSPWSSAVIARRRSEMVERYSFAAGGGLQTQVGQVDAAGQAQATGTPGFVAYGPYVALGSGAWRAEYHLDASVVPNGPVVMEVCAAGGQQVLAQTTLDLAAGQTSALLDFELAHAVNGVEARLHVQDNTQVSVKELVITPR